MSKEFDVQARLESLVEGPLQPGAVVGLLQDGKTSLYSAGHMERECLRPMTLDALFRISSMSKPLVALALLQLIEEGRIGLHDPVANWLPELAHPRVLKRLDGPLDETVPAQTPITVEHLLSSRFGAGILAMPPGATPIQQEILKLGLLGFGPDEPSNPMSQDEWLGHIGTLPLLAQPGTDWFYNIATLVQGILVSRLAGKPLSEQIAERITGPLDMVDTAFLVPAEKRDRLTAAYSGDMVQSDEPGSSAWLRKQQFETSMVSTAADYLSLVRMVGNNGRGTDGQIIGPEYLRWMVSDHLTPEQRKSGAAFLDGRGWGYGVSVDPGRQVSGDLAGEIGWAGGLGSSWTSDLGSNSAIVILGCRAIDDPEVYLAHVGLTRQALG